MRLAFATLLLAAAPVAAQPKPLFDGKSFAGWNGDTAKTWRVENGVIVGGSLDAAVPRNEFLATDKSYGDFELVVEFRLLGDRDKANAGIQFRSERIANHHEVIGYQADMGQQYWGALYDESRRNKILAKPDAKLLETAVKHDGWNTYRVRCEGPRVRLWLNDALTVDYTEPDAKVARAGMIALQVHGGGKTRVEYRRVELEELPAAVTK